jgi:hypothetical protein
MNVVDQMSIRDYHAHPSISKSSLDKINRSIAHYLASLATPDKPTAAMALGTAVHTAVLEPETLAERFIVRPDFDRRTKDGREGFAAWLDEHSAQLGRGAQEITEAEMATTLACAEAVANHPVASDLLKGAAIERSVFWTDDETGIECRCRPDAMTSEYIVDLKTTTDASLAAFTRSIGQRRYHVQEAFYLRGTGLKRFYFVAVETSAPYSVAVYEMCMESSQRGHEQMREDLKKYADWFWAAQSGSAAWTGYPDKIQTIRLPGWV